MNCSCLFIKQEYFTANDENNFIAAEAFKYILELVYHRISVDNKKRHDEILNLWTISHTFLFSTSKQPFLYLVAFLTDS